MEAGYRPLSRQAGGMVQGTGGPGGPGPGPGTETSFPIVLVGILTPWATKSCGLSAADHAAFESQADPSWSCSL
jgi:hypothetical protein